MNVGFGAPWASFGIIYVYVEIVKNTYKFSINNMLSVFLDLFYLD